MSRTPIPFVAADVAALARALQQQLSEASAKAGGDSPGVRTLGHVEILNLLARVSGFRNYQHLRASSLAERALAEPPALPSEPPVDHDRVARVLRLFDADGVLDRWPTKANQRDLCLWALWAALPARAVMTDRQISDALGTLHRFGDHALLRRELIDSGLFTRTIDGREYRRVERRPPPDARALIGHLAPRRSQNRAPNRATARIPAQDVVA